MAAAAVSSTRDAKLAICRLVEETSGHETVRYFGPGCLVKFESTEFLHSVGTPKSNYFLVASYEVLRKDILETLKKQETKQKSTKKREPSVRMVAEFPGIKIGGRLERKPLNELYSNLEEDVFELDGITFLAITELKLETATPFKKSSLLRRALEGNMSSQKTSDQLKCVVLCSGRTIDKRDKNIGHLSAKVYDLLQRDSVLTPTTSTSQFPSYFLQNEEKKRFLVEDEFRNLDGKPLGSIILNGDGKFVGVLNFIKKQPAPVLIGKQFKIDTAACDRDDDITETEMPVGASGGIYPLLDPQSKSEVVTETEMSKVAEPAVAPLTKNQFVAGLTAANKDSANAKQSPTENSCRSFRFNSSANEAEVEQDLKGKVLVVDLSPESVRKETPAPVGPEQRAHTNNNNKKPSVQDPAELVRDQDDDFSVDRTNNNDGPPAEAPGGETDDERADPNYVLPGDRSGDGSRQGQGNDRRSSFPPVLPKKVEKPLVKHSTSVPNLLLPAGRQRKFGLDSANAKQSPTENSCRSFRFNSSANEAEVEQDLKGKVLVVDLSPESVRKEAPAPVGPEQRAHTNNNNKKPSVQDPAELVRDQDDDFSVDRTNNNDGPPVEAPGGETDDERADPNYVLPQDRSGDGSRQGQGNERRSSFPPDLPKKIKKPLVKHSTSVPNQLLPAGRQRKFGLGDPLTETLLGSLEVLEASSRSLDKEYKYGSCKCWKHLAEVFGISKEEYESFKCNQVHSPTEVMFEYLESVMPDITVGDLKDGLAKIERQDVTDILIKHQNWNPSALNDETLVCSLLDSDPDIIGEMAVYLDKQKTGLKNWSHLAAKLGVPRKTFKTFETFITGNPTEEFFEIIEVHFPKLTIGELISQLEAIERRDVIIAIMNAKLSNSSVIKDLIAEPDVFDTVCELFNTRKRTTKVSGLKHLGRKLGIKKEILDDLLPKREVVESPTEALIRHLGGKNPSLTLENFIWALHFIDRPDVHAILDPYLPDGCIPNLLKMCDCESCKQASLKQGGEQQQK